MDARVWREFWRARGMRELHLLLVAAWDPLGASAPGAYDARALRIASLLGSRGPAAAVAAELGRIRRDGLELPPASAEDSATAHKIVSWFEAATA